MLLHCMCFWALESEGWFGAIAWDPSLGMVKHTLAYDI